MKTYQGVMIGALMAMSLAGCSSTGGSNGGNDGSTWGSSSGGQTSSSTATSTTGGADTKKGWDNGSVNSSGQ